MIDLVVAQQIIKPMNVVGIIDVEQRMFNSCFEGYIVSKYFPTISW
jgi:hypothetical protein